MFGQAPSTNCISSRLAVVAICGLSVAACSSSRVSGPSYLTPPEPMTRNAQPRVPPRAQDNYDRARPTRDRVPGRGVTVLDFGGFG
jgi:hypothetical protein